MGGGGGGLFRFPANGWSFLEPDASLAAADRMPLAAGSAGPPTAGSRPREALLAVPPTAGAAAQPLMAPRPSQLLAGSPSSASSGSADQNRRDAASTSGAVFTSKRRRRKCRGSSEASAGLRLRQGQPPMGAIAGRTYLSRNHHYYYYHYHYH